MSADQVILAQAILGLTRLAIGILLVFLSKGAEFAGTPFVRFCIRLFFPEVIVLVWAERMTMRGFRELIGKDSPSPRHSGKEGV